MPDCWPIANSTTCSACRTVEDRLPSFECSLVRIASSGTHSASRSNRTASLGLSFSVGCGQSLAHTMRSGAALMYARADLGVLLGARQLDPGPSPVDELADRLEARIVQGIGLCQPAEMIEHVRGGHAQQQVLDSRDLLALHVDLDVPAEIVDPLRQRLDHLRRGGASLDEIEADAPDAEAIEAFELGVGDRGVDDGDAPGGRN